MTRAEAGRLGGRATLAKHGAEFFLGLSLEHSHKGGRPRARTIEDIRQTAPKNNEGGRLPTGLKELIEALKHRENLAKGGLLIARKTLGYTELETV